MDGVLEELLRLEDAKHRALIAVDSEVYEDSVQKQARLINGPEIFAAARTNSAKLIAFSKLANINTRLYENLLSTVPWISVPSRSYTEQGQIAEPPVTRGFSAEA